MQREVELERNASEATKETDKSATTPASQQPGKSDQQQDAPLQAKDERTEETNTTPTREAIAAQ